MDEIYVVNLTSDDIDKILLSLAISIARYENDGRSAVDSINMRAWHKLSNRLKSGIQGINLTSLNAEPVPRIDILTNEVLHEMREGEVDVKVLGGYNNSYSD